MATKYPRNTTLNAAQPVLADFVLEPGCVMLVPDYFEIPVDVVFELAAGALLEITAGVPQIDAPAFRAYPMLSNQLLPAGTYASVADYLEIPAGLVLELGVNAVLEILPDKPVFLEIGL